MNLDTWLLNNHVKRVHDLSNLPIAKLQELSGVVMAEIRHKQEEQKRQESAKIQAEKEELKTLRARIDEIELGQNPPQPRIRR